MTKIKTGFEMVGAGFKTLKDAEIAQVSYVPDAGHADLISACLADDRGNYAADYRGGRSRWHLGRGWAVNAAFCLCSPPGLVTALICSVIQETRSPY